MLRNILRRSFPVMMSTIPIATMTISAITKPISMTISITVTITMTTEAIPMTISMTTISITSIRRSFFNLMLCYIGGIGRSLPKCKAMTIIMQFIYMMMMMPITSMVSKQRFSCCYTKEC